MPFPVANSTDLQELPTSKSVNLLADVAITPVNTFVDVLTFGTLPAGKYLISGHISIAQITAAATVTWKFLNGAAVLAAGEKLNAVGADSMPIGGFVVNILAAAIVKVQLASTALTSSAESIVNNNGTGTQNFASWITAVRLA